MITALYGGLLGLVHLWLTYRVIAYRRSRRVDMGDAGDKLLQRLVRAHANFAEYVPLTLVLILALEQSGSAAWLVHLLGAALVVGRLAHAYSFSVAELRLRSREVGMTLTLVPLALAALLCVIRGLGLG